MDYAAILPHLLKPYLPVAAGGAGAQRVCGAVPEQHRHADEPHVPVAAQGHPVPLGRPCVRRQDHPRHYRRARLRLLPAHRPHGKMPDSRTFKLLHVWLSLCQSDHLCS